MCAEHETEARAKEDLEAAKNEVREALDTIARHVLLLTEEDEAGIKLTMQRVKWLREMLVNE